MDHLDRRVRQMLTSPLGCAFLASAAESGLPTGTIAHPENSLRMAAKAVNRVERWLVDHEKAVADAPSRHHWSGTSWCSAPGPATPGMGLPRRLPSRRHTMGKAPRPPSLWERHPQKPLTPSTSTPIEGGVSSIVVAYDERSGDYAGRARWNPIPVENLDPALNRGPGWPRKEARAPGGP